MKTIKRFEEIEAWQLARDFSKSIWEASTKGSLAKDSGLKRQINRASGSIMDNIAEGFGRGGNKEFINFLGIARASNDEVRSQLYRAFDRKHLSYAEFNELIRQSTLLGAKINKFILYLKESQLKGHKFK